ncbi:hydroxyacylglutathione hydrolase [Jannaschia sp. LMIT008]|uniref:hydroxyacylglutathione hydrolase n=1 Tax=Jannaschia maritima TaxID=3032585 RepID=UPI00281121DD|nr:hydroxyacylglutathione hydrolase [Jannaschia sp. LMIT008]
MPMPPHVPVDVAGTALDDLVVIPMLKDRFPDLLDNYGYLARVGDRVIAIDCARARPYLDAAAAMGWAITDVLLTHHHPDHVAGVDDLRQVTGAAVRGNAADAKRLPRLDRPLSPGDAFDLGGATVAVRDVSGHTIGHVAYFLDGIAFTGDSLMAAGCGRLFEGTPERMHASLALFDDLPDDHLVASGHEYTLSNLAFARSLEPDNADLTSRVAHVEGTLAAGVPTVPSSLGLERRTNPFLRSHVTAVKRATGTEGQPDTATFAAARRMKDAF